ncbi:MAG: cysteine dioxygenase family protein [Deltaproteobacteria bacterium]|nr:cysteine dioxygenase family protein [Deltaproteobacteria bacterium]
MPAPSECPRLKPICSYLDSLTGRMDMVVLEQVLRENPITIDDVEKACAFNEERYQRNKVAFSDWYDLLVICWRPGQGTAIHDHTESSCGFKILKGTASEIVYERSSDADPDSLLVRPVRKRAYAAGEICLAQDQDIHRIINESSSNDLVTLHIYSPPLHMKFYEVDPSLNAPGSVSTNTELGRLLSGRR